MSAILKLKNTAFDSFKTQNALCDAAVDTSSICLEASQLNKVKTIFDGFYSPLTQGDACKSKERPTGFFQLKRQGIWETLNKWNAHLGGCAGINQTNCQNLRENFFECGGKDFLVSSYSNTHAVGIREITGGNRIDSRVLCDVELQNEKTNLICFSERLNIGRYKPYESTDSWGLPKIEYRFSPTVALVYDLVWNSTGCFEKIGNKAWQKCGSPSLYEEFIQTPLHDDLPAPTPPNTSKPTDENAQIGAFNTTASIGEAKEEAKKPDAIETARGPDGTSGSASSGDTSSAPDLSTFSLNPTYLKAGVGIATTVFFAVKAYKETRKLLEESRRMPGKVIPRKTEASRLRASAYAGAAAVSAGLSVYTLRA